MRSGAYRKAANRICCSAEKTVTEEICHRSAEDKRSSAMFISLLSRLFAAMIASRQRRANEELKRHGVLLPFELEQAGWKLNERNEDSLPFAR
jgi:hypothetical protein